ncbi:MAG: glutathione S-transferase family protein [Alphaproteobacteria bacterium]
MIKLHHLQIGRSIFTLWLLEELGIDYDVEIYQRLETFRAPPELKKVHPLGKSPVIEDDGIVVAESGAIATYLLSTYGQDSNLAPAPSDKAAFARYQSFLHFAEGTLVGPFMMTMVGGGAEQITNFAAPEIAANCAYLADELAGKDYIMGNQFSAADVGLVCVLSMANNMGALPDNKVLQDYIARCTARPAFASAMEKGGGA